MSRPPHAQPENQGASSSDAAPKVVVRAGKTYLCSACGTLVEIPEEFVGQFVVVPQQSPSTDKPQEPEQRPKEAPLTSPKDHEAEPPATIKTGSKRKGSAARAASSSRASAAAPRLGSPRLDSPHASSGQGNRPRRPRRPSYAGRSIDGLPVPTARQLDRAFAWVVSQLQVLDQQETQLKQLRKKLKRKRCARREPPSRQHAQRRHAPSHRPSGGRTARKRGPPG